MSDKDGVIRKVMTFKSGQFVFSRLYDPRKIDRLDTEAFILQETVKGLPIQPPLVSQLREELIRRSIFGTAAIEGNPLTEEKVGEIISTASLAPKAGSAEREIRNLKEAYDRLESYPSTGVLPLNDPFLKELHRTITEGIPHPDNRPGQYRNHVVHVGDREHGGVYTPPKILEDISKLMREYVTWINSMEVVKCGAYIRAALAHYYLALIHPFADGNGRVARLVEAHLLHFSGIDYVPAALSNYYYRHIDEYFRVFSATEKQKDHSVTPFLTFVLTAVVETLKEIKESIVESIRKLVLREYYSNLKESGILKDREYKLLYRLLDDAPIEFRLEDLYKDWRFNQLYINVSQRTARRDLKHLCDMGFLNCIEGKYELNMKALDRPMS